MEKNVTLDVETTIPKKPFGFFRYVSRPFRGWVIVSLVFVIAAAGIDQSISYLFKLIVDAVEVGDIASAATYALVFPIALFVVQMLYRASGYTVMRWSMGAKKYGYDVLSEHILRHSHSYFVNRFAGSILSKTNNIMGAVEGIIPDLVWTHLTATVAFFITFGFILTVDVLSAVIFVVLTVVLIVTNRFFAAKKRELSRASAESGTVFRGQLIDVFSNVGAVRQYAKQRAELARLQHLTDLQLRANNANWMYTEKMLILNSVILFIFALAMFYFLIGKWQQGLISSGDFVLVLGLVSQMTGTLIFIGRAFNNTARALGEMEEGLDDILVPYELTDVEGAAELNAPDGAIVWRDVSFHFDTRRIFDNFNLDIEPRQRIGLVGPSGAGKSTFVSLLLRQHDINAGEISIDGQNIAEVTQDSLRRHIAVVPQEPLLFHRTIRENIAYSKPDASDAEIEEVARKAQAHDFIMALPERYDTLVGERGVKLSGGQKQRVAIARAMLKDAPILVLDEATSALDSESEVAIQKALHELMEGKTVIAIAHRLSTLREMDRIIVLENGRIVEDGTHGELAGRGGLYARLWEHQAGGFLQE